VRVRKRIEPFAVVEVHDRSVEFGDVYEGAPDHADDGRIVELEDGSVSVPLFEEQVVVEKRLVLRERVVIRKAVLGEHARISEQRDVERVEIEAE
jgi:stress response protein YsnF